MEFHPCDQYVGENRTYKAFFLLQRACIELARASFTFNNKPKQLKLYKNFIYSRMMWGKARRDSTLPIRGILEGKGGGGCGSNQVVFSLNFHTNYYFKYYNLIISNSQDNTSL